MAPPGSSSSSSSSPWPWDNLGAYKYLLYAPLFLLARPRWEMESSSGGGGSWESSWCLHVLVLSVLRYCLHNFWYTFSSMLFLTRSKRISKEGVDFQQIDREWNWDNLIMLHAFLGSLACYFLPSATHHLGLDLALPLPAWNRSGLLCALLLHMAVSEPLYYWVHRRCHSSPSLYAEYHSTHHSSEVLQPFTAAHATPLEHTFLCLVMSIPLVGATLLGHGSVALVYAYVLAFDFLRCMMHSNVEIIPHRLLQACPPLKYLIPTPTYHTLHHRDKSSNFCLFMPLFDAVGGTVNTKSWELHRIIRSVGNEDVPGFVFLAHVVDVVSSMHAPFVFRGYSSLPYSTQLVLLPLWPVALGVMFIMWASSKTFLVSFYNLRGSLHQTWVVPRFGFQYFLPFAQHGINEQIELAILRADRIGVKVLSLAALNKNEALNGGGTLFVKKHPNLRVRVVHGNTLTAAVILNEIPEGVGEVFLTGATSKLGRAIALYLCRKKTRVLMLTLATERFQMIQKEAPPEFQQYLVQVTKYQAAQNCKTWIVGKWLSPSEQQWAPPGTHFHQFVVPPMFGFRRDCTYGNLAAMRLPDDVQGLGSCEYTLERGVVHACHAGGVVHFLEGWTHHEVGAIDVDRIDTVWEAALKHGLRPLHGSSGRIGAR